MRTDFNSKSVTKYTLLGAPMGNPRLSRRAQDLLRHVGLPTLGKGLG